MRAVILLCWVVFTVGQAEARDSFLVLSYHDVRDGLASDMSEDQIAVSTKNLIAQFEWLREHGYSVVSIDRVLDAEAGRASLPEKSILLSFDDGYVSVYSRVYPLLKLYGYPAVVALVGTWMLGDENSMVDYGHSREVPRSNFLTWPQIREMQASGLVEIASHSFDLHRGVLGNPQGNLQPAATTRIYDPTLRRYESDRQYRERIRKDLLKSKLAIFKQTGNAPRVMVWPYGAYNQKSAAIARDLGMSMTMALGDGDNSLESNAVVNRILVSENPKLEDFVYQIRHPRLRDPHRVVHVDLDYIFDTDSEQTEKNLGRLLDRILAMKVSTVFLQAFADPDGDGNAEALYFPNRHLPMRADLFNRVAWQLKTRAQVAVYAWMPVLAFDVASAADWKIQEWTENGVRTSEQNYRRLSPFHPQVRRIVGEIYEDLAKNAPFAGILFHDDAMFSDFEDANPFALEYYRKVGKLEADIGKIRSDKKSRVRWTQIKIDALNDFTRYLADRVRIYRPEIKTARNLYARPLLDPRSEEWFAQSFSSFLNTYDYTAVMAMPFMEDAEDPELWLRDLVNRVKQVPDAFKKTIFELQSTDWRTQKAIPNELLVRQMKLLQQQGAIQYGYYPDDLFKDHPKLSVIQKTMSLRVFPFGP